MAGLRIALFSRSTPAHFAAGGMERHTDQLARGLARRGHAVTLFTTALPPGGAPDVEEAGLELRYLAGTRPGVYGGGYWPRARAAFADARRRRPFDAILSQSAGAWGVLDLPASARPACLAVLHGNPRAEMATAWRSAPWHPKTWARTAILLEQHFQTRRRLPQCAGLVAVSSELGERLRREFPGQVRGLRVIPNGIAIDAYRQASPAEGQRVLYTGRVIAAKGVFVLVDAFAAIAGAYPDARLRIIGDGQLTALRRRVARWGLTARVEIVGAVPHAQIAGELAAGALFVLPTQCTEGLPLGMLEAMASGLPVVAIARGGIAEVLRGDNGGVLLAPAAADARSLARALGDLFAAPAERERLGRAARQRIETAYSETAMLAAYESWLCELAGA
ncbi:glycosyltransferase family 4 protein [bacterium]|nr:glycosyltransferase family 4 protein [bacterium]